MTVRLRPGWARLAFAVVVVVGLPSCADEADPSRAPRDPALRGPWQVGVTTIGVADSLEPQRRYDVELWYPARPDPDAPVDEPLGIPTGAVRDAPADGRGAPFPLVAFSHGSGGLRFQSFYLSEHLASHGYVVVAPDHLHNTAFDDDPQLRAQVLRRRPEVIGQAIDLALARAATPGDLLADMVDAARVGVAGHSFGGHTALVLAGARMDVAALRASCAQTPDQRVCEGLDDSITQELVDGFADGRVRVALALAPGGVASFGPDGLAATAAPAHLQGGTLDTFTPLTTEVEPIHAGLAEPRSLLVIEGAAHFSFTDICPLYELLGGPDGPLDFLATEGCGANTAPLEMVHAASRTDAVIRFDAALRGP